MEKINAFIGTVVSHIGAAFLTIIGHTILFALVGLAVSVLIIYLGRKKGWFTRPFRLWSGMAKLHYLYLPFLFVVFGGSAGVLSGVHSAVGHIIDDASEQAVAYGQEFIVDFKSFMANTPIERPDGTIAVLVDKHLEENTDLGWFSKAAMKAFNTMFVEIFLEAMGVRDEVKDPGAMAAAFDTRDFPTALVSISSSALHTKCDVVFWSFFLGLWGLFSTFFLLPVIEFGLYLLVRFFIKN